MVLRNAHEEVEKNKQCIRTRLAGELGREREGEKARLKGSQRKILDRKNLTI